MAWSMITWELFRLTVVDCVGVQIILHLSYAIIVTVQISARAATEPQLAKIKHPEIWKITLKLKNDYENST